MVGQKWDKNGTKIIYLYVNMVLEEILATGNLIEQGHIMNQGYYY